MTLLFVSMLFSLSCSSGQDPEPEEENEIPPNQLTFNGIPWTFFNKEVFSAEETENGIQLDLEQNALWFQASSGGLLYQTVSGDFTFSATVSVRRKSNGSLAPNCNICLGGLMARNPNADGGENYVHLVSGNTPEETNDGVDELGVEHKSTLDSVSFFNTLPDGLSDHGLRIRRQGSNFSLYVKNIGQSPWQLLHTYDRPDLPTTLQVGLNIYTAVNGTTADLRVIYEDIVLE
ncbi:hypothetical protein [Maribacter sp. 2304DJ31-5]|uniref:hypothetical protein n=1 Tax=Maribacter sp. 2304DJ31-5 TaxID=3386273 RepID=UPI0039BCD28F